MQITIGSGPRLRLYEPRLCRYIHAREPEFQRRWPGHPNLAAEPVASWKVDAQFATFHTPAAFDFFAHAPHGHGAVPVVDFGPMDAVRDFHGGQPASYLRLGKLSKRLSAKREGWCQTDRQDEGKTPHCTAF